MLHHEELKKIELDRIEQSSMTHIEKMKAISKVIDIPGLLTHITKASDDNAINNSVAQSTALTSGYYSPNPTPNWDQDYYKQYPFTNPNTINTPGIDPWTKTPAQMPYVSPQQDPSEYINNMLKNKPAKSSFEEMIDLIFSYDEKKEYLIGIGYDYKESLVCRGEDRGTIDNPYLNLHVIFLKEITIKFKNLLLAKASLKIKL